MSVITITVKTEGFEFSGDYVVYKTEAPREYDGFGTLSVYESGGLRQVLIRKEHLNWQLCRYGSGLHRADELPPKYSSAFRMLAERLVKAIPEGLKTFYRPANAG